VGAAAERRNGTTGVGGIRIKATASSDGRVTVKSLFTHVMESGRRLDPNTGEPIPPHYIKEVTCEHGGRTVLKANWGPAVSKNPYFEFQFTGGAAGETIKLSYVDSKGEGAEAQVLIR
jgi:sulfur-oxidizing protein SoxZ